MRTLALILYLFFGFAVTAALGQQITGEFGLLLRLACWVLLSFVAVLAHELGHTLAAWAVGAKVREIVVYPLAWRAGPPRLSVAWRTRGSDIGGFVRYELDRIQARGRRMVIAAAGPLANLLLAGVSGFAASRLGMAATLAGSLFIALALLSAGMGLANLVPYAGSDGSQIWRGIFAPRRASGREKSRESAAS